MAALAATGGAAALVALAGPTLEPLLVALAGASLLIAGWTRSAGAGRDRRSKRTPAR